MSCAAYFLRLFTTCHSGMFSSSGWDFTTSVWVTAQLCVWCYAYTVMCSEAIWWGQLLHTENLGSAVLSYCLCFHPSRNASIPLLLQFRWTEICAARCWHPNTCYGALSTLFLVLGRLSTSNLLSIPVQLVCWDKLPLFIAFNIFLFAISARDTIVYAI